MKKLFLGCLTLVCIGALQAAENPKRVQQELPVTVVHGYRTYDMTQLSNMARLAHQRILRNIMNNIQTQVDLDHFFKDIFSLSTQTLEQLAAQHRAEALEDARQKAQQAAEALEKKREEEARCIKAEQDKNESEFNEIVKMCMDKGGMTRERAIEFALEVQDYENRLAAEGKAKEEQTPVEEFIEQTKKRAVVRPAAAAAVVETQADRCARGEHRACNCLEELHALQDDCDQDEALARALQAELDQEIRVVEGSDLVRIQREQEAEMNRLKQVAEAKYQDERRDVLNVLLAKPAEGRFKKESSVLEKLQMHKALLDSSDVGTPKTRKNGMWAILKNKHGITKEQLLRLFGQNREQVRVALQALDLVERERESLLQFLVMMLDF